MTASGLAVAEAGHPYALQGLLGAVAAGDAAGRTVVSIFPAHVTGSLLQTMPAGWARHESAGLPFTICVGA